MTSLPWPYGKTKAVRNAQIVECVKAKVPQREIAIAFNISQVRVGQILKSEKRRAEKLRRQ